MENTVTMGLTHYDELKAQINVKDALIAGLRVEIEALKNQQLFEFEESYNGDILSLKFAEAAKRYVDISFKPYSENFLKEPGKDEIWCFAKKIKEPETLPESTEEPEIF